MASPIHLAVAGCGQRPRLVVKNLLEALSRDHGLHAVIHACDPDPAAIASSRNVWPAEVVACDSWAEALTGKEVTWALVGSWNCFHAEQIIAAFRAGKHVFAEKPLATTVDDCLAVREAWRQAGKLFFFGLVLRYSPFYQRIFAESRPDKIGPILSFESNETLSFNHGGYIHGNWRRLRKNAGTHLLEKCCHDMDIALWLAGDLPVRVASFGGTDFFQPGNRALADHLGADPAGKRAYETWPDPHRVDPFGGGQDIVDNQVAIIEYAGGARATFHTNCNAALPERRVYLLGTEGAVRADANTAALETCRIGFTATPQRAVFDAHDGHAGGDEELARRLVATMIEGQAPAAGMDEALRSTLLCLGIDQALDSGTIVDLRSLWHQAGIR